jgi:hypothetical protein
VAKVGYAQPTSAKHTLRATQRYARQAGCIITYPMLVSLATDPFPLVFGTLIGQLNKHLGTRFVPGHIDVGSPLARDLEEVLRLNNGHDYKTRDLCMMRLITLARDLEEIASADPTLARRLRREFRRAKLKGFPGFRFEVHVASSLCRAGLRPTKQERPDFAIEGSPVGIECGSVRLNDAVKGKPDSSYKLSACIRDKASKRYSTANTALFIDFTNLTYNGFVADRDTIETFIAPVIEASGFGAIAFFAFMARPNLDRVEWNYMRFDAMRIAKPLAAILDRHFPRGSLMFNDYLPAREG